MKLRLDIAPSAQADILDHAFFLSDQSHEVSDRFYDNVFLSLHRLTEMPEFGGIYYFEHTGVYNIRIWPVKGFRNYLIFYRVKSNCIQILLSCTVRPITKRSFKSKVTRNSSPERERRGIAPVDCPYCFDPRADAQGCCWES